MNPSMELCGSPRRSRGRPGGIGYPVWAALIAAALGVATPTWGVNVATCVGAAEGSKGTSCSAPSGQTCTTLTEATMVRAQLPEGQQWKRFKELGPSISLQTCASDGTFRWVTKSATATVPETPPLVVSGPAAIFWEPSLKNNDQTAAVLTGYRLDYGAGNLSSHVEVGPTVLRHVFDTLAPGTYQFQVVAIASYGESPPTNPVTVTVTLPSVPQPPGAVQAQAATAYTVVKGVDRFTLLPVGTIALGTPCIPTQTVNGFYAVPRASVTFSGNVRPPIVLARCGT